MIEIKNVSFKYNNYNKHSLTNINLKINEGEFVLICGPSGSGKTSITRLINGLIPNYYPGELKGEILIKGKDALQIPNYKLSKDVGSVFQNPRTQFFNVDTDSEIVFGLENEGIEIGKIKKRLEETTSALKIRQLRNRNIFQLSGGEKQKIAFSSIYAMNPSIYLLDEPSSNLDNEGIENLKNNLSKIKSQGKTVLIAEHKIYYLKNLFDRVIYMKDGQIEGLFSNREFLSLSSTKRASMGLRSIENKNNVSNNYPPINIPFFKMNNLTIKRGEKSIINDLNLEFSKGEIICILGSNGIGKTTLLRTICGLHKQFNGQIYWNGKIINSREAIKNSYMVMQDANYQLFAESVFKECTLGLEVINEKKIINVLKELNLYELKDRHPNTLSGGQKQRLTIAVSIILDKELIVFDEPTSGIDFHNMLKVVNLIKKISKDKIIIIATHDYEFTSKVCTRIINLTK